MEIKSRFTGDVLFEAEIDSVELLVSLAVKSDANLSYADLRNADLIGADLIGANLSGADLSGAKITIGNRIITL